MARLAHALAALALALPAAAQDQGTTIVTGWLITARGGGLELRPGQGPRIGLQRGSLDPMLKAIGATDRVELEVDTGHDAPGVGPVAARPRRILTINGIGPTQKRVYVDRVRDGEVLVKLDDVTHQLVGAPVPVFQALVGRSVDVRGFDRVFTFLLLDFRLDEVQGELVRAGNGEWTIVPAEGARPISLVLGVGVPDPARHEGRAVRVRGLLGELGPSPFRAVSIAPLDPAPRETGPAQDAPKKGVLQRILGW